MEENRQFAILVVDDTETNIDILMETLGDEYDIRVALDGESALNKRQETRNKKQETRNKEFYNFL